MGEVQPLTARDSRLASRAAVLVLAALLLTAFGAAAVFGLAAHRLTGSDSAPVAACLALAAVGCVIAWHRPGNPMGWILAGAGGLQALSAASGSYSVLDYRLHHGTLPLGPVAVLIQPAWAATFTLLGLGILLFPDGRLPSVRWRLMLWPYLGLAALYLGGAVLIAAGDIATHDIRLDSGGTLLVFDNPSQHGAAWWGDVQGTFLIVLAVCWLSWLARQVIGYRHTGGERRLQLKWLLGGGAICVVFGVGGFLLSISTTNPVLAGIGSVAGQAAILALPLSIGLGILKFRLYDIDRIISRTVSYTMLTGLLVAVYAGLVLLATRVLPISSSVAVAGATLAVAALFNQVRHRLQRSVDRRFNRARYDADQEVAAFAGRLSGATDLAAIRDDLATVVQRALEPTCVSVWISTHG
ncbi:MAG TPA: hypothetical protein VIX86_03940 [Streptosporangiaceae bacterium]